MDAYGTTTRDPRAGRRPWRRCRSLVDLAAWSATLGDGAMIVDGVRPGLLRRQSSLLACLVPGHRQGMHHAFFELGPLLFWLLAVPVHLDTSHGALWGAALVCGASLSLAVEAMWSVKRFAATVAVADIVADVGLADADVRRSGLEPSLRTRRDNVSGAPYWVVAPRRLGWYAPWTSSSRSLATQSHLFYAVSCASYPWCTFGRLAWASGHGPNGSGDDHGAAACTAVSSESGRSAHLSLTWIAPQLSRSWARGVHALRGAPSLSYLWSSPPARQPSSWHWRWRRPSLPVGTVACLAALPGTIVSRDI